MADYFLEGVEQRPAFNARTFVHGFKVIACGEAALFSQAVSVMREP
jgi:hypothetical protein